MGGMFVSIVGMKNYFGVEILKPGMILKCIKEPSNLHDEEAIRVELSNIGTVGYIANSCYSVAKGTRSSGFIYSFVEDLFFIEIQFIIPNCAIGQVVKGIKKKEDVYYEEKLGVNNFKSLDYSGEPNDLSDLDKFSIIKF